TPASASFNTPTICSSLNRLFFMGASPLVVLYPEKLTFGWTSFRGAGQGGYTYYHPVELFCIGAGTFTALLGIVGAVAGKGNVDGHVAVISILNLLLWFIDGVSQ
ncbi:MAG TPA: hypothetical protein VGT24_10430, partial [Candidatus Acidoferrales bacterium]|nr:hypothetical protein [Candidatus Acidoferrales bacterium]